MENDILWEETHSKFMEQCECGHAEGFHDGDERCTFEDCKCVMFVEAEKVEVEIV